MKQLNAEIVAVGTELLLGQIANTNAQWISQQLALYGVNVLFHSVVGDNLTRVHAEFEHAAKRSDIVIVTGGLGPTDDDLTREAYQLLSGTPIIEHKPSMDKISSYFDRQNGTMTPNNKKQARVFEGATILENKVGMAPGMIITKNNTIWIFLPGVPKEMKQLFSDGVLPYIKNKTQDTTTIESTMLRFIGIGESQLEHEIKDIIAAQSNPTIAPLAQTEGVAIRLTAKAETMKQAKQLIADTQIKIEDKAGAYLYGIDDETIEQKVFQLLLEQRKTVAAAESLTGGLFTDRLIGVEGASAICPGGIVCYDTKVKEDLLHVPSHITRDIGVISAECAESLALNVRSVLGSSLGISFTGVAGPDKVEGYSVGTVYIGIVDGKGTKRIKKFIFNGDRQTIRKKAVWKGYQLLFNLLK
ncbi:competence/damage-inducible protein A [Virgibacillus phasianinus]|uniref:Putative competence-damage inducible protein n=2 Tax=Virgibacillus phasianinus TaxID=2017483 RepID=A0A220U911_9BACI|nr:competence/damage-inducible protein A [Virgibacillus phasianinus]ASK64432.1 competence/damage-inducible protein A [Virgibacillus phasianinus]